jgi:outer membrane protein assembly factor BamB
MLMRTVGRPIGLMAMTLGLACSIGWAADGVELRAKLEPGRTCVVDVETKIKSTSKSPMGDFDMTFHAKNATRRAVSPHADGVKVADTIDRASFVFDSSMGRSFYDSDIPDEEESEQWQQILAPQIGMTVEVTLDANHQITGCSGMKAIAAKIDSAATGGNMFWMYEKPRYTDERHQENWRNDVLSIFPNRTVQPGESWTARYLEPFAELKDFYFDCTYTLEHITRQDGRTIAMISFTGKIDDPDRKFASDGMMPMHNVKLDKATLSGKARIDVERGELVFRNDNVEVAYSATMSPSPDGPGMSSAREIQRTYSIKTLAEREAEKQANAKIAAAKRRDAEAADAERRRRFADVKQVDVDTATRKNPIGNDATWPQWGGPHGDFKASATGLADQWPETGPKQLWRRDLGDGYSSIAHDGKRLYTMYRPRDEEKNKTDEYIVALDPNTGKTVWEFKYAAPFEEGMDASFGRGPHSTPLIVGDRLFAVGAMVMLHCLDKNTGEVIWSRDLHKDFDAATMMYGYGASPLAYQDTIILPVGGKGQSVIAFKQSDGSVAWQNQDFGPTHASIGLVEVGGVEQLILFAGAEVVGLNPTNGERYWRVEHPTEWGANISTPVWGADGILFISSAYGMGSRGIQLSTERGKPVAKELWHNRKMKIHHGNAVRVGNFVYGASGDFGPVFYAAVDAATGEFAWRSREVGKSTSVFADGKMIVLNENGELFLATVAPAGIKILSQVKLCDDRTWTTPTLVNNRLFLRDRHQIMALDLK